MPKFPERRWIHPVIYMAARGRGVSRRQLGVCSAEKPSGRVSSSFSGVLPVAEDVPSEVADAPRAAEHDRRAAAGGLEGWLRARPRGRRRRADRPLLRGGRGRRPAGPCRAALPRCERPSSCERPRGHRVERSRSACGSRQDGRAVHPGRVGWRSRPADRTLGPPRCRGHRGSEIVSSPNGEAEALGDKFPMLRARLDADQRELLLQPCAELRIERFTASGRIGDDQELVVEPPTVHYLSDLDDKRLLRLLDQKLSIGLDESDFGGILRNLEAKRVQKLRAEIRKAPDDADSAAAGRRRGRTAGADSACDARCRRGRRGRARRSLDRRPRADGARAPRASGAQGGSRGARTRAAAQWAGSRAAVSFVRELGFGVEYAGFESRALDRLLEVEGPPEHRRAPRLPRDRRVGDPSPDPRRRRPTRPPVAPDRSRKDARHDRGADRRPGRGRARSHRSSGSRRPRSCVSRRWRRGASSGAGRGRASA